MRWDREKKQLEPTGCISAWGVFLAAAGLQFAWFAFGTYLFPTFDPVVLIAFGIATALVVFRRRPGRGIGPSARGVVALVAFLAALGFALTRPLFGLGDVSDLSLIVTVRDAGSRRPVSGALVTASDGRRTLAGAVTDDRGRATLRYEFRTFSSYSRLLSRRAYEPEFVTIEARAESRPPGRRVLRHAPELRLRPFGASFGYPAKQVVYETTLILGDGGEPRSPGGKGPGP